ncbi:MAG: SCP2 sterol-binding domain-containing protein [Deltaproteobacteria bacterium]|nr:SCP2 sterol-binding domain-containing protein [Deltaproteobacteria bacterium]
MITEILDTISGAIREPRLADLILADMHLYAVLPRLEELARLDEEAGAIARELDMTLEFLVRGGPRVVLTFADGKVTSYRMGRANTGLFFLSCDLLNRMFAGEDVTPIPFKGITRVGQLKKFTRLTEIMTRYLKPSDADMEDAAFRKSHVEMSLMVGLSASGVVADRDPRARRLVDDLRDGTIQYKILPDGPNAYVRIEKGVIRAFNGIVKDPTACIEIRDVDLAVGLIAGEVDTFAANGSGDVKASGDLAMADEFNGMFDRVGLYLE